MERERTKEKRNSLSFASFLQEKSRQRKLPEFCSYHPMRGCGGARRFHAIHQTSDVTEQVKGGNQSGVDIERVVRTITSIYIRDAEAEDLEPLRMEDRKGGHCIDRWQRCVFKNRRIYHRIEASPHPS